MKKTMLFACCATLGGLICGAETTTVSEDKTSVGNWEVTVAEGDTVVVTAAQTGSGKIVKRGGGFLTLQTANAFSGGLDIEAGVVCAEESGCLGSGTVTVFGQREGYSGACELRFTGHGKDYGTAPIVVSGNSDVTHPAIGFYAGTNTYSGTITAANDLYFLEDSTWRFNQPDTGGKWSVKVPTTPIMTFGGAISAGGTVHLLPDGQFEFAGSVSCPIFETILVADEETVRHANSDNYYYGNIYLKAANAIGTFSTGARTIFANATGALGGANLRPMVNKDKVALFNVKNGTTQTLAGFDDQSGMKGSANVDIPQGGTVSFTLTGTVAEAVLRSKVWFGHATQRNRTINLTLDAQGKPGFVQALTNSETTAKGTVAVENGTLRFEGTTAFPYVTSVTVGTGGRLELASSVAGALAGLTSLSVSGALVTENGVAALPGEGQLSLALTTGATLSGVGQLQVKTLTVDGQMLVRGVYTHANLPVLPEGVTIETTTGAAPPLPTATATWTGADPNDNLMTTAGNWEGSPASLDLSSGTLAVKIGPSGTEMIPAAGTRVNAITNARDVTASPFVLGAKGQTLTVDRRIEFVRSGQVELRGTIGTPYGFDQGEALENGVSTFLCRPVSVKDRTDLPGDVLARGNQLPVILNDATVDKPFFAYGEQGDGCLFYARANTTNRFNGAFYQYNAVQRLYADTGAEIVFAGGVGSSNYLVPDGPGTIRIVGKPIVSGTYLRMDNGRTVIDAEGCSLGGSKSGEGLWIRAADGIATTLEFARAWGVNSDGVMLQTDYAANGTVGIEFNATTQKIGRVYLSTAKRAAATVHGTHPACLQITGCYRDGINESQKKPLRITAQVTGGLSIHYLGTGAGAEETLVLSNQVFASCGDLAVSGGTLELSSNASWLNGTNFLANGTGILRFAGSGQVAKTACLVVADSGKVDVKAGTRLRFASVTLDGDPVSAGEYASGDGTAFGSHLLGGGTVRVGSKGLMLLVR